MSTEQYAKYDLLPKLSYNIISNLMNNSDAEIIWKLLSDKTPAAWDIDDLTKAEKRELIYDGIKAAQDCAVFLDSGMDEVISKERIYLRIYPYSVTPDTPYRGIIDVAFEMLCHNNINTLSNYTTRVDSVVAALLRCLNGADVESVGAMFFDAGKSGSRMDKLQNFNQIPFKAKILIMSVRAG